MSVWTEAAVTAALGVAAHAGDLSVTYTGIGTDTRTLQQGELFVALRGAHHDAHAYLLQAHMAGASGAVVDHVPADAPPTMRYYVVPDTLAALGLLARARRRLLDVRVCAVAGSNGKTTTKELLRAALSARFRVHATQGNLNNLIGAPLTLLRTPDDADVVIAEIGTNSPGEIAQLSAIVEPDAAVVTGISAEHLEGLGDIEGVLREETAVLGWVPRTGMVVVADDPPMLAERARGVHPRVQVAGLTDRADAALRGTNVRLDEEARVAFTWSDIDVSLELRGRHNARNALVALGIASAWGVPAADAAARLAQLESPKMRSEIRRIGDLVVIADCYNANPASMRAAIDMLASMPRRGGRVAVLGSMLELGPRSGELHREIANDVVNQGFDVVVATGEFAAAFGPHRTALGSRLITVPDPLAAWTELSGVLQGREVVLLKGSRGVALERLLPHLEEQWGSFHPHGEAFGSRASSHGTETRDDARPAERPQHNHAGRPPARRSGDAAPTEPAQHRDE